MVNKPFAPLSASPEAPPNPERALALFYAPVAAREGLAALFALDDRLGHILRATREPMVGQMRLTWWHEALTRLDTEPPPAEPVLAAVAAHLLPAGIAGARLAEMIDGWEILLDADAGDDATLEQHAVYRGVGLFGAAATLLRVSPSDPVAPAGRGWALADLARHLGDDTAARRALALAAAPLEAATSIKWSRAGRSLGALTHLARMDLSAPLDRSVPVGSPARVWRLLRHRMTGK